MSSRIPLPGNGAEALQRGVEEGMRLYTQNRQHAQSSALREQEIARLMQLLPHQINEYQQKAEYHPFKMQNAQQEQQFNQQKQPLELDKLRAQIEAQQAQAFKNRQPSSSNSKTSELERIAAILSEGDPERQRALLAEGGATKYGLTLPGSENLPVGSQPFKSLPKNLQAQENADQIKMQTRVNDAKKAYHDLDEMDKIINSNPDMARDFAYIIGNPEDKSFVSNLARRYVDKKKLAAVEKFVKYSNDFVLSAGSGMGNNFTDAKLKALQLSKMHAGNTDAANRSIINNYRIRLKPLINYGQELKKARGKYTLPYFEESYTDESLSPPPIESLSDEELEAMGGDY